MPVSNIFSVVNGGGNPFQRSLSGNAFTFAQPKTGGSGSGNCYTLFITFDGGATISSVAGTINGSLGSPVASALGGAGNLDTAAFNLPGVTAGLEVFTVTFSAPVTVFTFSWVESYGIATSGALNGTKTAALAATPATASFTPTTNNDANGGNLILVYACKAVQIPTTRTSSIQAAPSFQLLGADIGWNDSVTSLSKMLEGFVQPAQAAVTPSFTSQSDGGDTWNVIAIALKLSPGSGTPPPAGIQVNAVHHFATVMFPASGIYTLQCPSTGNLLAICCTDANLNALVVDDTDNNVWDPTAAPAGWWFLKNASPNSNLRVRIRGGGGDITLSWRFFDISGADPNAPFDSFVTNAQSLGTATSFTATPSPSPTSSNGLTIPNVGLGAGPGLGVTTPAAALWGLCNYAGETDTDLMENADICAVYHYTAAGSQTWNFSITSNIGNSTSGGFISFKAAPPALPVSRLTINRHKHRRQGGNVMGLNVKEWF